jgi:hypothetical protein
MEAEFIRDNEYIAAQRIRNKDHISYTVLNDTMHTLYQVMQVRWMASKSPCMYMYVI